MARNKRLLSERLAQATAADGERMNFVARVGMTPNQHSASTYRRTSPAATACWWNGHRGSWVIGEAVDAIPDDMTRKGITSRLTPKTVALVAQLWMSVI